MLFSVSERRQSAHVLSSSRTDPLPLARYIKQLALHHFQISSVGTETDNMPEISYIIFIRAHLFVPPVRR